MRILITGGAGFIGSHLADKYLSEGWEVRVLDSLQPRVHPEGLPKYLAGDAEFIQGDVTDLSVWNRALEGVDVVSHQAAYQDYFPDYGHFSRVNVLGTALLFESIAAHRHTVRRIVVASSQAVYGEGQYRCPEHGMLLPPNRPLHQLESKDWEVHCPRCQAPMTPVLLNETHPSPLSPYGVSKYAQEITALRLAAAVGVPCTALRYSITQGARQSLFNQYSGIARIFALKLKANKPPIAFEDGGLQRDYVHVADVVAANWLVSRDERAIGEAFNVGSGRVTTVLEYARRLAAQMGKSIEPEVPGLFRVGDARHSCSSIEKIGTLGWKPERSLDQILADFLAWVDTYTDLSRFSSDAQQQLMNLNVLRMSHAS